MTGKQKNPARSFIIETQNIRKETLVWWRLEQRASGVGNRHEDERLYCQVREHLDDLQERTGCYYFIRAWGSVDWCDSYVDEKGIEVN